MKVPASRPGLDVGPGWESTVTRAPHAPECTPLLPPARQAIGNQRAQGPAGGRPQSKPTDPILLCPLWLLITGCR